MKILLTPLTVMLLCHGTITAQSIELRTGTVELTPITDFRASTAPSYDGRSHFILQFAENPNSASREKMESDGLHFIQSLRQKAWVASTLRGFDLTTLQEYGLTAFHIPTTKEKVHPTLCEQGDKGQWMKSTIEAVVLPYDDVDLNALLASDAFRKTNAQPTAPGQRGLLVSMKGKQLMKLLEHPALQWAEAPSDPGEPEDTPGRTLHRVHALASTANGMPGLDGTGVTVVVNDDGFVGPHIDLHGRTEQGTVASDLTGDHGDMVTGIVAGAGNLDPSTAGMAPGAFVHVRQYSGNLPNTVTLHQNDGAMVFNSSYSNGCNAGYTNLTQQVDQEIIANPSLIQVFSAGNSGGSDCGYGAGAGWGNITGGHKIGKNVIATANLTNDDLRVASSSRGPSQDGRIKPDISANGNGQISLDPDNQYGAGGGTSAASPGIVGTLAVLYEGWRSIHNNDPASGLMKAFLLNTADDLGNVGPDYSFGWGRVNATRAWRAIEDGRFLVDSLDQGDVNMHTITVPAGIKEMRVMLYWMDPAGSPTAATALVNDLDLLALDPGGTTMQPWVLETAANAALLAAPATNGADHLNNMEQVAQVDPANGVWTFQVTGFDVPQGVQKYFIVHEFISSDVEMVYPIGGECLPPGTHRVRWDAVDVSAGFDISLSLDGGTTWNPAGTTGATQHYLDVVLPNNVTSNALIQVEQANSMAQSDDFSIMGTPINLQVTANCLDSAILSWSAVAGADEYVVYVLGPMYMDSVGITTNLNYTFNNLQPNGEEWFSVSALTNGGACSERAIAVPRPMGLFNCPLMVDLLTNRIISPPNSLPACQPQNQDVRFTIVNNGSTSINTLDAFYSVNGATPVSQMISTPIPPADSIEVVFASTNLNLSLGLNVMKVWGVAVGEQYPVNDTITHFISSLGVMGTLPYSEDWESTPLCNDADNCDVPCPLTGSLMSNEPNGTIDVLDWRSDQGGTPSTGTGPTVDHTLGNASGNYAYVEATPSCILIAAELVSPCLTLPSTPIDLTYWYHMSGVAMGDLHMDVFTNGEWDLDVVPAISGNQGNTWQQATVPLDAYMGDLVNFRFRGVTGTAFQSDIAIDDIMVMTTVGINEAFITDFNVVDIDGEGNFLLTFPQPLPTGSSVQVFDAMGRSIIGELKTSEPSLSVDLHDEAPGVYLFRLTTQGNAHTMRVVRR